MKTEQSNSNKIFWFFLICHALVIILLFVFVKREYHSDEIWSFGIANGSEAGAVFQDADWNLINVNRWESAEVFHENLTAQRDERFHFGIAYRNSVDDAHPPFSFMLLHLMSSFFPDRFSFWFYIPFNILAMLLCDIFLYKILKLLELPERLCLLGSICFAFCCGGINIAMFIRMYALLVAFGLLALYLSLKVCREKSISLRTGLCLVATCFFGGITEYEYYVYSFILTVTVLLLLLFSKKVKTAFFYGLSMAVGVGISLLAFPEFFNDMLSNSGGEGFDSLVRYPYGLQMKMLVSMSFNEIIGFFPSIFGTFYHALIGLGVVFYIVLICVPLFILLRKSPKFIGLLKRIGNVLRRWFANLRRHYDILIICAVVYIAMLCIMNSLVSVYHMGAFSSRYIFVLYPAFYLFLVVLIYCITNISDNRIFRALPVVLLLFFCVTSQIKGSHVYMGFDGLQGENVSEIKDSDLIIVTKQHSELERIAYMIDESNRYICIRIDDLESFADTLSDTPDGKDLYLAVSAASFHKTQYTDFFTSQDSPVTLDNLDTEEVIETNKEEFLDDLKRLGICRDYEYMGEEVMLNTMFYYYRLQK